MGLEERMSFRNALLSQRTEEEWKSYRPCTKRDFNSGFYDSQFVFEGEQITGIDLIKKYSQAFSSDREYSPRAQLNRMLTECNVPQFSFSNPEVLKSFLLSARSQQDWKNNGLPSIIEFGERDFQYSGFRMKGKMLAYNVFVELENQHNKTHYSYGDYLQDPNLKKALWKARTKDFYLKLFELAGLKVAIPINPEEISSEKLREILLNKMSEEEWQRCTTYRDFDSMKFNLEGHSTFKGKWLRENYNSSVSRIYSVKDIFEEAGISFNPKLAGARKTKENYQQRMSRIFENSQLLRHGLLGIMSQEEWSKPKEFLEVRLRKIDLDDRTMTLHTLMHNYRIYKHNKTKSDIDQQIGWTQLEENYDAVQGPSSRKVLDEILNLAGIHNSWFATFEDVNLRDPKFIRRILLNAEYNGKPISIEQIRQIGSNWRSVHVKDPEIGLDKTLHSLVQYFIGYDYWKNHPEDSLTQVTVNMKKGKSSRKALNELLNFADFEYLEVTQNDRGR